MDQEKRESIIIEKQGQKIFAVLHLPIRKEKVPAVLICHGLAGHKVGKHRMYVILSELLAKEGIASLRFDFRGHGDSEGHIGEMTIEGELSDALSMLDYLRNHPQIDALRLGICGRSFGGAIAIMAARKFGKIKSIALWAPIFNAKQWEEKWEMSETGAIDQKTREKLMRINGQMPSYDFYRQLFSLDLEPEIKQISHIPMLHIHGEQDPIVSIDHADFYQKAREQTKVESKFIKLRHSDHDFTHPEEKQWAIEETCDWFKRTL